MAPLKYYDKHNQVGFLRKPDESDGFAEIVDFLKGSHIRYALTHNPSIYDSLVKQFWKTATAISIDDQIQEIKATIDFVEYSITEASIRDKLQLADVLRITMLPNNEIFEGLGAMSYKSRGWDQFGSNLEVALIYLSTGRIYNFSKLIFDGMVSNLKSKTKFLMYPHFLQIILDIEPETKNPYLAVTLTKKIFGNMKRGFQGVHKPLLPVMLAIVAQGIDEGQDAQGASQDDQGVEQEISGAEQGVPSVTQPQPSTTNVPPPPPASQTIPPSPTLQQPPTSTPYISSPIPITPPLITTIEPHSPPPLYEQEPKPIEHIYKQQSPQPLPRHTPEVPQFQVPTPSHKAGQLTIEDLSQLVPQLIERIDSLKKDLRTTKQTFGNAILSLVKKVKTLETALKRKTKKIILSESEEEGLESQGRKFHKEEDDTLISLVKDLLTPAKETGKVLRKAQDKDISLTTLEAAQILSKVTSQKYAPKEIKQYSRRKISFEKVKSGKDNFVFEEVSSAKVNTATQEVNTGSINISTGIESVSTDSTRMSAPSPPRTRIEGKAPITEEDEPAPKKSKI
ncbi:hypothetical protein Tco_1212859 [Tanacetum coccineum]